MVPCKLFILLAIKILISTATEILYVLPDNSTSVVSCPSQPCATLSQYVLDNGTLPVVSNVEYHFLPGEHRVPANMVLKNLHNFSMIGIVSKLSPLAVLTLADCLQSYIIKIIDSYNIIIANLILKQCDQPQSTDLLISLCYSCTIENIIVMNLGIIGENLLGRSYITKIVMKSNRSESKFQRFCQKIVLKYWNLQSSDAYDHEHYMIIDQVDIIGDGSKCCIGGTAGLHIYNSMTLMESLTIYLTNSSFSQLDHTALTIIDTCDGYNKVNVENCTFESNYMVPHNEENVMLRPLIDVLVAHNFKSVSFKQCKFTKNYHASTFISIVIRTSAKCHGKEHATWH